VIVDFHNHTTLCGHAVGTMEECVERAIELGISEWGFSEHSHWMIQAPGEWLAMKPGDLDGYVQSVYAMQRRYNREGADPFHVRLGMEMDFVPSRLDEAERVSEEYDWDYRIGSVHHIGLWGFDNPEIVADWKRVNVEDAYELYFELIGRMVDMRFCEIVGHLDLPKIFKHLPEGGVTRYVEPLIPRIVESGVAVEINTAGRDKPIAEFFPSWEIVELLIEAGVPITLGADAHAPKHVGRHLPEAIEGLRARGLRRIVRFEKRRMIPVEI
jgi:histidinol-phosphatase (PHP family)